MVPSREELIALCEAAVRAEKKWRNRDSAGAQRQVGEAWVLLRAGCEFSFSTDPASNEKTIWIRVRSRGFNAVELGSDYYDDDLFYIPTRERLEAAGEEDWY